MLSPAAGHDENFADGIRLLNANTIAPEWVSREFVQVDPNLPIPDFVDCAHEVAFMSRVLSIARMKRWLEDSGELLQMRVDGHGIGFILHCLRSIEAVNFQRSKGKQGTRGWLFYKLVLKRLPLNETTIFSLAESGDILLADTMDGTSGSFRHVYEREGLTGLKFIEVPVMDE